MDNVVDTYQWDNTISDEQNFNELSTFISRTATERFPNRSFRLATSFDLRLRNQNVREFGPDATIPANLMISRLQRYRLEDIQRFIGMLEGYVDRYGTMTAALSELFPNLGNSGESVQRIERVNVYMYPTGPEPRVNQRNIVFG
jgi:hypothetical protein